MKWTTEQLEAINEEGTNIIVSAGAGSGKTAVLSERVLRKVQEGIDIRNILILTFTNEAAGEMKERIRKKLTKNKLYKELVYLDSAYITTFDAYALSMVKKYHYLLNIPRNISIIDSSIIDLEKERLIEEIFKELYDAKDPDFLKLIGDFTNRDDQIIKEAILNINKELDLKYSKKEYLENYLTTYFSDNYIDNLLQEYFLYLKELTQDIENDIYALESLVDEKLYLKLYEKYSPIFNPKTYNDLYNKKIGTIQFRNIPEEAIPYKESLKEKKEELEKSTIYTLKELKDQIKSTYPYLKIIIKIILELDKRLTYFKNNNASYEFIDIAKMAIKIVKEHPKIKEELKLTYNEILIDEYQDTNDLQEMFISEIANNNVYMVGDIKQSIYRFRNANPTIFKEKYDNYKQENGGKKIDLLKNFRSRNEVLTNINEIFNLIMSDDFGGANYQKEHQMHYGNLAYSNEGTNNNNNNLTILKYESNPDFTDLEIEAFTIAQDIKEKIKNNYQVFDFELNKNRNATYQDFCIILDRGTDMPEYKKIFEYLNIPLEVYKDSNLINNNDILIIKNILGLILNIKDNLYDQNTRYYFVSIGRSFVGNLNDNEILKLLDTNTFYQTSIYQKCSKLTQDIELKTPSSILNEIFTTFNFYENIITTGDISSSLFRLDYLKELATNVEKLGYTIEDFKDYLNDMINKDNEIRYKESRGMGNSVKIMNIHKSKGLEFPICYYAGLKKKFNLKDLQNRFMFDNKYGILTPFYNEGIGTLITKTLIKRKYYQEEISEKIRLFYVALTRAKEKLIMVLPTFQKEYQGNNHVTNLTALKYRSFYDFLNSISLNLAKYSTHINLDNLGLTKQYNHLTINSNYNEPSLKHITFKENNINSNLITNKHASKTINNLISKEEAKTLEYGTLMHQELEMTNFKNENITNDLKTKFDFLNANIYQELEFIFEQNNTEYHGIIDLMLEYDNEIKIIDYKLKNINDEAYSKQLSIYYEYLKTISKKEIKLYLYSIIDKEIKEIEYVKVI